MRRVRKTLLVMTGLVISGINPTWAITTTNLLSNSNQIRPVNKYLSKANTKVLYELNYPADLSLPSFSREVLIKTDQRIKLEQLEKIILHNNPTIKIYREKIDQAKSLLKNSLSLWYPTLNLNANGLPKYFESNNYNQSSSIVDTSSKQWSSSISAKFQWDLINPARIPEISAAKDGFEKAKYSYSIILKVITTINQVQ